MTSDTPSSHPSGRLARLVSVNKAAEILGVHHQTVRKWISNGELPAYRFRAGGRAIRLDTADLEHLMRRVPTTGGKR